MSSLPYQFIVITPDELVDSAGLQGYAGIYYSADGDILFTDEVFLDSWPTDRGPIRDNVSGPFATLAEAEADYANASGN